MTVMLRLQCNCDLDSYMSSRAIPIVAQAPGCPVMIKVCPLLLSYAKILRTLGQRRRDVCRTATLPLKKVVALPVVAPSHVNRPVILRRPCIQLPLTHYTHVAVAFLSPSIFRRGFLTTGAYLTPDWIRSVIGLILADMDAGGE